jgi:hypothetical protein
MRLILLSSAGLGLLGCASGSLLALPATRFLRSLLFEVDPLDPIILALAALSNSARSRHIRHTCLPRWTPPRYLAVGRKREGSIGTSLCAFCSRSFVGRRDTTTRLCQTLRSRYLEEKLSLHCGLMAHLEWHLIMGSQRAHIVLPEDLIEEIDQLVGPRGRSAFLVETARAELRRRRLLAFLRDEQPAWGEKDHPELEAGPVAWVRSIRSESEKRIPKASRPARKTQ